MLRRLYHEQPDSFAFTPANQDWAEAQITKFPEGRQASAIIPLLWRAQEQEGWLTRPAIEHVADMLGMAYIRALEVASFYFMFQLQPVGSVAHIQVCGTTSCMICGAEDLMAVCQEKIAPRPHELSADGKFSWEEVECLGACANAPMAQIGKDYYEDLTAERMGEILDELAAGKVPVPGPQNGRYAAEPLAGLTSLTQYDSGKTQYNASAQLAVDIGDTVKRIDGGEVPLLTPWQSREDRAAPHSARKQPERPGAVDAETAHDHEPVPGAGANSDATGITRQEAQALEKGRPVSDGSGSSDEADPAKADAPATAPKAAGTVKVETTAGGTEGPGKQPAALSAAREGGADDLKRIKGVGPKLEAQLNEMGFYHYDQVAGWGPDEVAWVDQNLQGFKGRVSRDGWVDQAARLAAGSAGGTRQATKKKQDDID